MLFLLAALLLTGCGKAPVFETVTDTYDIPAPPPMAQVLLVLPGDAAALTMEDGGTDRLYFCGESTITVQTFEAGDLDRTLRSVCGYGRDDLTVLETGGDGITRYDFVWVSAGEGGDQIGKAAILDDGNYHYALSVMSPATEAASLSSKWQEMFDTFWVA